MFVFVCIFTPSIQESWIVDQVLYKGVEERRVQTRESQQIFPKIKTSLNIEIPPKINPTPVQSDNMLRRFQISGSILQPWKIWKQKNPTKNIVKNTMLTWNSAASRTTTVGMLKKISRITSQKLLRWFYSTAPTLGFALSFGTSWSAKKIQAPLNGDMTWSHDPSTHPWNQRYIYHKGFGGPPRKGMKPSAIVFFQSLSTVLVGS